MLQLQQLLRGTPANIVKNSRDVRSRVLKAFITADEVGTHKKVLLEARDTDGPRNLVFKFYNRKKKNLAYSKVYVHCSCPYFLYFCEVAVAARGSSSVINSNGAYPKIRNPSLRPYLCKHLFQAARGAIRARAKKLTDSDSIDRHELERLLSLVKDLIPE